MTFQEFRTKLARYSSAEAVVLNAALMESESVVTLWKTTLGIQEITVSNPRVFDNGGMAVVTGKASFLGVEGMSIEAAFEDDKGILHLRLTADLPDTWKFGQSFPNLSPYFSYDSLNYGYTASYLSELVFSAPAFVLTTRTYRDTQTGIAFERGLNFRGFMNPLGPLRDLELVTGSSARVQVSGLIVADTPSPEFCLRAQIPLNLGHHASTLQFENIQLKLWNSLRRDKPVAARIEISMQLQIAGRSIEIYYPFRIGAPLDFVVIGGRFSDIPLPDLGKLAHLVGGDDLQTRLPPSLASFGGLTIKDVVIGFLLTGPELTYVRVCVTTTSPWTIIPEILEIDSLASVWLVESPFQSDKRQISCALEGQLHIADVGFSLSAEWPGFQVSGALSPGNVIKLGALLKHFVPSIPLPDDGLVISQLVLLLDPTTKTYQIDARVDNVWSLPLGDAALTMDSLALSLAKTAEQLTGSLTGGISLRLADGGGERDLALSLAASLPTPFAKGWQFAGTTGPGESIHLGKLIHWLEKRFGSTPQPSAVDGFSIRNLAVSFNTQSKDFAFGCEGEIHLANIDSPIQGKIHIDIKNQQGNSFSKYFGGSLVFDGMEFDLAFESSHKAGVDSGMLVASYNDANGHTVKIDDLIKRVLATPAATGLEISVKDALFAYQKTGKSTKYLFGLDIEGGLNLSELNLPHLPLIGRPFPAGQTLKLALQVLAAGETAFTIEEINDLNRLNGKGTSLPQQDVKGLKLAALLRVGEETKPLNLPIGLSSKGDGLVEERTTVPATTPSEQRTHAASADGTQWIKIQKTFGPMHVERVGIGYQSGNIAFLLDSALTVAGLTLSLDGLGAEFALKDLAAKQFKPTFHLNGLGIDYRNGPIEIGGSFLEQKGTLTVGGKKIDYANYAGLAVIRTAKLTLSAIGSYAQLNDRDPSLFIYAVANYPLGGPAFFYVTGFAAGFGYNRALTLPPIDAIASFPLVTEAVKDGGPANLPTGQKEQQKTLTEKLQQLEEYLPPSVGDIFVAAGIKFTSFKQIDSFALLVIQFGRRFEIDLLGLSTLTAPPPATGKAVTPVAEAQLALKASFVPDEGFLGVRAQLTSNSYILSKDCHLSGGFAFYTWFEPHRQAGDFVLTLGGYHPKFIVPDHYPRVPRLAVNWQVSSELHIKADAYFALTNACIMAGAHLEATWQGGGLRAWFNAGADFILAWKPYHYDVAVYVSMGVSYTFEFFGKRTVTADLGADLRLWGPEFSGTATIHWSVISFTVNFGQGAPQELEPIDWKTFKTSFLPKSEQICSTAVRQGLIRQLKDGGRKPPQDHREAEGKPERWIVNPKEMVLAASTAIPLNRVGALATHMQLTEKDIKEKAKHLAIAPMGIESNLTSTCDISIVRDDGQPLEKDTFEVRPIWKPMPAGLWGKPNLSDDKRHLRPPSLNGAQLVQNILTGFEVRPIEKNHEADTCDIERERLQYTIEFIGDAYGWHDFKLSASRGQDAWEKAVKTAADKREERDKLAKALGLVNPVIDFGEPVDQGVLLASRADGKNL